MRHTPPYFSVGATIAGRGPASTRGTTSLPPDLLASASKRLSLLAIVLSVLIAIFTALPTLGIGDPPGFIDVYCLGLLAVSIGVYFLSRSSRLGPQRTLDIGLVYEVTIASGAVVAQLLTPEIRLPQWGASEVCIIILLFPVLVPNTPRKVFIAAFLVASMEPLGVAISVWTGSELPAWTTLLDAFLINYACVGLAVVEASVLYGLGREVSRARALGAYRLTEPLGKGAMGEVWRAKHQLLARDAAIKIIQPDRLNVGGEEARSLLSRFEREAQATAALDSPHTVELYDFGVTDEGTFFYVMELLNGLDLQSLVQRYGPVSSPRATQILVQVCHSLADAHAHGLIHRDIKPANLFICRKGQDTDFVKVLDFGLVKSRTALPNDNDNDAGETMANTLLGTPAFMAPEMIRGDDELDGRADLYSLGCVGYWLLTGHLLFDAQTPMDMMIQHAKDTPEPPSTVAELDVDRGLELLIMQCLEKDPADRPTSAADLMEQLRCLPIAQTWTPDLSRRWWDRHALPDQGQDPHV